MMEDDPTLPVNFDESANPDQLRNAFLDDTLPPPMVVKAGSGRMSPALTRTMKEYDQQISDLKKENFNLKLRIFFLQDRIPQKGDGEVDLVKTNIELQVNVETLKGELMVKQNLLKKASDALELMTEQQASELQQARATARQEAIAEMTTRINEAERRASEAENLAKERIAELEHQMGDLQNASDDLCDKDRLITELRSMLNAKQLIIEQQDEEHREAEKRGTPPSQFNFQLADSKSSKGTSDGSAQAEIESLTKQVAELKAELRRRSDAFNKLDVEIRKRNEDSGPLQDKIQDLEATVSKYEDLIQERDSEIEDKTQRIRDLEKLNKTHEDNALKRDNAIKGLADMLQSHESKLIKCSKSLEEKDKELREAKSQLLQLKTSKYQSLERQMLETPPPDERINQLEDELHQRIADVDKLQRNLKRTETEVKRLNDEMEKSDQLVREREDAMQDLRQKLQDARREALTKAQSVESQFQALLDDAQRQIGNQEKMLQRMTNSLQEKDKQLQQYVQLLSDHQPDSQSKDNIISSLRQQLQNKEKTLGEAIEEKFHVMEERDTEVRQLKMALREKEHDLERANHMLLTTEETIDILESENKEKEKSVRQLEGALKMQEKTMQEMKESHASSMEEKESLIQKLRATLANKDKSLQDSIRQSPSANNTLIQQMQAQLRDKDSLLEELMAERARTAESHDSTMKELLNKLSQKDDHFKEMQENAKQAEAQLTHQMQSLQTELNKKDYDLTTLESRSTWAGEQQQEILDKLKAALHEKDRTIEALVESAQEKDKLLTKMRDSSPSLVNSLTAAQLADMQSLKDQVAALSNDLQNKSRLIDRLRAANERRSPKLDMIPRQRYQDLEDELDQRNQNDLRSEVSSKDATESALRVEIESLRRQIDCTLSLRDKNLQDGVPGSSDSQKIASLQSELLDLRQKNAALSQQLQIHQASNSGTNLNHTQRTLSVSSGKATLTDSPVSPPMPYLSVGARSKDSSQLSESFLPSFNPLPDPANLLIPDDATLSQMSLPQMQGVIKGLRNQLSTSGRSSTPSSPSQKDLTNLREENKRLTSKLHLILYGPASDRDVRIIPVLKQELQAAKNQLMEQSAQPGDAVNGLQAEIGELRAQLEQSQERLKKQENASIMVQMAQEIERLKRALKEMGGAKAELSESKAQNQQLQNTLASTEATVRSQSEKIKHYRGLLEEAGRLPMSPPARSHSESNLAHGLPQAAPSTTRTASGSHLDGSGVRATSEKAQRRRLEREVASLRKMKEATVETAATLQHRLREVSEYIGELLHQDQRGEVDVMDVTPERVTQLKQTLNAARSLVNSLQKNMQAPEEDNASSSGASSGDLRRPSSEEAESQSQLQAALAELEAERQQLLQRVESLNKEVERAQEELFQERERCTQAEQEVERSREQVAAALLEKQKLAEELREEELSHQRSRDWLKQNQAREETLRKELSRMNGDLDERNTTINTLRQKLESLQQQRKQHQDLSPVSSPERVRAADSLHSHPDFISPPSKHIGGSTSEMPTLPSDHVDSKLSSLSPSPRKQHLSRGAGDLPSTEDYRPTTTADAMYRSFIEPTESVFSSDGKTQLNSTADFAREISKLQFRLNSMDTLNRSLRQELDIYTNITNTSIGVQNTPSMAHDASQTFYSEPNSTMNFDLEGQLHEVRLLQQQLMESLRQNDELRELLQVKLTALEAQPTDSRLNQENTPNKQQQQRIDALVREIDVVRTQLQVQTSEVLRYQAMCEKTEAQLSESAQRIRSLETEKNATDTTLRVANNEVKRLKTERDRLKLQVREQHDLNASLKQEMVIYNSIGLDDVHRNTGPGHPQDDRSLNRLLLQQMRQLRHQLEKSIHNNNQLRQDLERYMQHRQTPDLFGSDEARSAQSSRATSPASSVSSRTSYVSNPNGYHSDHDVHRSTFINNLPSNHDLRASKLTSGSSTKVPSRDAGAGHHEQYDWLKETAPSPVSDPLLSSQMEHHMRYSVLDARRPPSGATLYASCPSSRSHRAGMSPNKIGSDLRSLYAVGSLDDYELLKKQVSESQGILAAIEAVLKDRLSSYRNSSPSQNIEYTTMKQLASRAANLRAIHEEERRLVALFWLTQLPVRDERGNFVDVKMTRDNQELQHRLRRAENNVQLLKDSMESAVHKMAADLKMKKELQGLASARQQQNDDKVIRALTAHLQVLCQARHNLEAAREQSHVKSN